MEYKDYYATLGVERGASDDEIKRAYKKLARKYHPDVSEEVDAEARFKEVGEAYDVLKDPERRAAYDSLGNRWRPGEEFEMPGDWDVNFEGGGFESADVFSEFFSSLFGDLGREATGTPSAAIDSHTRIFVTLEDLVAERPLTVDVGGKTLRIKVPHGIVDGDTFRLREQGQGIGGQRGDLYVEVRIIPHPRFQHEGRDVTNEVKVTPWEAILGERVPVETLHGSVMLKIPPGTQGGTKLRLAGKGLYGGDQFVTIAIDVPSRVSEEERQLVESLAKLSDYDPRKP